METLPTEKSRRFLDQAGSGFHTQKLEQLRRDETRASRLFADDLTMSSAAKSPVFPRKVFCPVSCAPRLKTNAQSRDRGDCRSERGRFCTSSRVVADAECESSITRAPGFVRVAAECSRCRATTSIVGSRTIFCVSSSKPPSAVAAQQFVLLPDRVGRAESVAKRAGKSECQKSVIFSSSGRFVTSIRSATKSAVR